jgi:hypothetical protein
LKCEGIYNLYSGTLFEKKHLRPSQVVLLLRSVAKGEPSTRLAQELGVSRTTVHHLRKALQQNAQRLQPEAPLIDEHIETDEMFQNAGEKGRLGIRSPTIRQGDGPTSAEGTAATTTTARR